MAINPNDLTVSYRTLQAMPFRDRRALMYSNYADQVNAALTPSQRANLFPSYYRPEAAAAQSALTGVTGAAGPTNLSKAEYLNKARNNAGVSYSDANKANGNAGSKAPPKPTITAGQFRAVEGTMLAGSVDVASRKEKQTNLTPSPGSPGNKKLLELIASGEGGYNSSNRGTIKGKIIGSTHETSRGGKPITELTVAEVMKYQSISDPNNPDRLFAVGKYQLIPDTFKGAVKFLGLKPDDKITPEIQEKMGLYLVSEKRPAVGRYIRGESDDLLAAQKELSLEFASIPVPVDMMVEGNYRPAGASAYGSGNRAGHSIEDVRNALLSARTENEAAKNQKVEEKTATEVPGSKKTMVISMGTNDWDNPKDTYQNTLEAIKAAQAKGYEVVVVPPKDGDPKFQAAHDEVMKAVGETGVKTEVVQDWSGTGGYHPSNDEAKRIAEKYPGQTFVGDSIAKQMGTFSKDSTKIATDGLGTGKILENMQSDQVATLATKPETPQDALAIAQGVASQIQTPKKEENLASTTEIKKVGKDAVRTDKDGKPVRYNDAYYEEILNQYDLHPERKGSVSAMDSEMKARLGSMFRDAPDFVKKELKLQSGYRDQALQDKLYAASGGSGMVAKNSQHTVGRASDLGSGQGDAQTSWNTLSPEARDWIVSNAGNYGLYRPLQPGLVSGHFEDWHFEPIGNRGDWKSQPNQPKADMTAWVDPALKNAQIDTQVVAEAPVSKPETLVVEPTTAETTKPETPVAESIPAPTGPTATQVEVKPAETPVASVDKTESSKVATVTEAPKANTVALGTMAQGGVINPIGDSEIVTRSPTTGEITQRTKVAEYGAEQIKIEPLSKMNADALSPQMNNASDIPESEKPGEVSPQQNQTSQKASMTSNRLPSIPYSNIESEVKRPTGTALRAALQIRMHRTSMGDYI